MALEDDLKAAVAATFREKWTIREGLIVPEPEDLALGNQAVHFDRATILYADLSGSTKMVDTLHWEKAAEIYKTFLHCAAKIILAEGGSITAYDGDRIMATFIGDTQTTPAARAGLKINYAVNYIVNPAMHKIYGSAYSLKHVVGIDTSEIHAARTGVRGGNDIVWVGRAANYAAKLTELDLAERTFVTDDAFQRLHREAKYGGNPEQLMWKRYKWSQNNDILIHGSTWWWRV
jgi:class 3 adenylate cyclase